jgi:hypothetical protein
MHAAFMEHMRANDPAAYDQGNGLAYDLAYDEAIRNLEKNALETIKQIKGSGKKDSMQRIRMANTGYADNPDAHLVPYIQDFIRSGKWSDINNLEHSGMQKWNGRYLTREDIDALSPDELDAFTSKNADKPGFAQGGSVYSPDRVNALVAQLKEEMYG